jgi:hypothetical protein
MQEIWIDIKGFEDIYQISKSGKVRSKSHLVTTNDKRGWSYSYITKEKILKNVKSSVGYAQVNLYDSRRKKFSIINVHRLVALHFIPNLENKEFVNHRDGNKMNSNSTNLEWCTRSENMRHAYDVLKMTKSGLGRFGKDSNKSVSVLQLSKTGKKIRKWDSMSDAWREEGFRPDGICRACSGYKKYYKGYKWKYAKKTK